MNNKNLKIGVDIEDISRFSKLKFEQNKNFYKKIFTKNEIEYCIKYKDPYPHFTVRFCAKEAAIKALNKKIKLTDIEIKIVNKKPIMIIPPHKNCLVSLSHTNKLAIAFVLINE